VLGPLALTRLLERKLAASRARVVTLGSVSHRAASIASARAFLTHFSQSLYHHTKLANVLLAFELQVRTEAAWQCSLCQPAAWAAAAVATLASWSATAASAGR
jgi:NAD(P)-dependent dehydrogenase (short-subunit alcohol dehydrogenase family)